MTPDADPRPLEPEEPDLNDCCGNGCEPCVFDTYIEEKRAWEQAIKVWEERHRPTGAAKPAADSP
ncbi:oxidoreductase-like domain-containing protein [Castellaniella sp. GW247-6E4]|uniref:oxidoreductase-like domain-containing protein n=1 Tax=Castellaniella sp. GW247-6E4 TaxID=3140380 RepID=UPI003315DDF7